MPFRKQNLVKMPGMAAHDVALLGRAAIDVLASGPVLGIVLMLMMLGLLGSKGIAGYQRQDEGQEFAQRRQPTPQPVGQRGHAGGEFAALSRRTEGLHTHISSMECKDNENENDAKNEEMND